MKKSVVISGVLSVLALATVVIALGGIDIFVTDVLIKSWYDDAPTNHVFANLTWNVTNPGNESRTVDFIIKILGPGHAEAYSFVGLVSANKTNHVELPFIPCSSGNYTASINVSVRAGDDPDPDNNYGEVNFKVFECTELGGCGELPFCTGK